MMLCKSTLHSCVALEDELISRDLRPILNPEDAQAIQKLVKNQKSRLKPYMKKYSGGILDDPIWKKWDEEDSHLKVSLHLSHRQCWRGYANDIERSPTNQTTPHLHLSTGGIWPSLLGGSPYYGGQYSSVP
jgi:hypothetical protein